MIVPFEETLRARVIGAIKNERDEARRLARRYYRRYLQATDELGQLGGRYYYTLKERQRLHEALWAAHDRNVKRHRLRGVCECNLCLVRWGINDPVRHAPHCPFALLDGERER